MKPTAIHHDCGHHHGDPALLDAGERRRLAARLIAALVAAGLLGLSGIIHLWRPADAELPQLVAALAAALLAVPVATAAWHALREPGLHGATDLLVAVALVAAWVVGDLETAALVPLAMVIGHAIEERSLLGSQEALAALTAFSASRARRLAADGSVDEVAADALSSGDRIELRSGDRCPADGRVVEGVSCIDAAPVTGESVPQDVGPGDRVHAGTMNQGGRLVVEVEHVGADTALGRVVALIQDAERSKPAITRLLDRFAAAYLLLVILAAVLLGFATGSASVLMATLVAGCPCALVVAAPATAVAAIAAAARSGILVKGSAFLERLAECDAVVFDKTGTLTHGELQVVEPVALDADKRRRVAALGRASTHPVARACAALAEGPLPEAGGLREESGMGIAGTVEGVQVRLGREAFLIAGGAVVPRPPEHDGPVVGVVEDAVFAGWLLLADAVRSEAVAAVAELRRLGIERQVLCTGDRRAVAERVAASLRLSEVDAECLPEGKLARVRAEIAAGHQPLVVGDGINDSLALRAGAVGVAIGGRATDVAVASADLALVDGDLRRLPAAVRLARTCRTSIAVSIAIAVLWTLGVIALAAAGRITPVWAAMLHNLGTVAVIIQAGRLVRAAPRLTGPAPVQSTAR